MIHLETKIKLSGLPNATKNILIRCNILTINDLMSFDIDRLYGINGLGSKRINEIINYVGDNGFFFKQP